jgi:hypothetical protein
MSFAQLIRFSLLGFSFLLHSISQATAKEDLFHSAFAHPIDIVYLWVDGNDPNWLPIKDYYLALEGKATNTADSCTTNRFSDHEELKYSLRSLLKFAPFFHHIYIVTMNQRPYWLLDHPQITIIDHTEIFPCLEDLPTFNSHALESNLHRIPGLAEHFIYFNDDVLLGLPVSPSDFFTEDGHLKVLFERGLTVSPNPEVQASLYRKAWLNSSALLDFHFVKEKRRRLCHAPFALRKSLIETAENLFPFVFASNASHRFRSAEDFNLTNGLLQYIWKYQGYVKEGSLTNKMISVQGDSLFLQIEKDLSDFLERPLHTFCIQDCMTEGDIQSCQLLQEFFHSLFPDPAPWEEEFEMKQKAL